MHDGLSSHCGLSSPKRNRGAGHALKLSLASVNSECSSLLGPAVPTVMAGATICFTLLCW